MSAAAELRAAASKLRELAQRATPGPWGISNTLTTSGDDIWIRDAVYIATVDPMVGVALADLLDFQGKPWRARLAISYPMVGVALADLLDSLADDAEQFQPDDDRAAYGAPPRDELVLARLINRSAS